MTFQDIFKSSFLENITSVSIPDLCICLALSFALGMFIFLIYKKTYAGVMYSSGFGVTLLALSTVVMLAVTSNVVLSLGMVGALSIVRFRAAIKEPLDIAFLFWAIAVGIVLAAGMLPLAVIGSVVIGRSVGSSSRYSAIDSAFDVTFFRLCLTSFGLPVLPEVVRRSASSGFSPVFRLASRFAS